MVTKEKEPALTKISRLLNTNRAVILLELCIFAGMILLGVKGGVLPLFIFAVISLWLRKRKWSSLGFKKPANLRRTVVMGVVLGVVLQFVLYWMDELLSAILRTPAADTSELLGDLPGNLPLLLISVLVAWTLAAFGEELVYRGYCLNRITDLWGPSNAAWVVSAVLSSVIFALTHQYQGVGGVIQSGVFGLVMAMLYLARQRNLALPILVHGVYDTVGLLLIFYGYV